MAEQKDYSAILPDGGSFDFWEKEPVWQRELYVRADDAASDRNDGSEAAPFRTIGRAAAEATPGTRIPPGDVSGTGGVPEPARVAGILRL